MDIRLNKTTQSGVPLLGPGFQPYLELQQQNPKKKYAKIIACFFVLLLCLYVYISFITIPKNPLIIAVISGKTSLSPRYPHVWQDAVDKSSWPVLIGISVQNNKMIPFAVTLNLSPIPIHLHVEKDGLPTEKWYFFKVQQGFIYFRPSALDIHMPDFTGKITANGIQTSIPVHPADISLPGGNASINILAFPEASSSILEALAGAGYDLPKSIDNLQAITLQLQGATSTGARLDFSAGISQKLPKTSLKNFILQDETTSSELLINENDIVTTSTENLLSWQSDNFDSSFIHTSLCQNSQQLFYIDQKGLERISALLTYNLPFSGIEGISTNGYLDLCFQ